MPDSENIRTLRAVLNTLGDGFVEAVDDRTLLAIAANQPTESNGLIHGKAIRVPILEAPGHMGVGRFGWKDQDPTILSFAGDAYLNEMGVTNRLKPIDVTSVCKASSKMKTCRTILVWRISTTSLNSSAERRCFHVYGSGSNARRFGRAAVIRNRRLSTCHVPTMTTDRAGTKLNGGAYTVPEALGSKIFHPFGDFLLHDVGTGDGIVQAGPQDTANKLRTTPLWGSHTKSRFMHDLASFTLEDAIQRHGGEARAVTSRFNGLSPQEKQELLTFLRSL